MKRLLKIPEYLGFVVTLLFMLAAASVYIAPHFGVRIDHIASGSMEPTLERGTMTVAFPVRPEAVKVGDIIIFRPVTIGESLICHRVIEVRANSPRYFITKGDAMGVQDPFRVPAVNVVGRVVYHADVLGFLVKFLKTPVGFIAGFILPGTAILVICLKDLHGELRVKTRGGGENSRGRRSDSDEDVKTRGGGENSENR